MIAKARSISHGSAMTNYATKHICADIVLTRNLGDGLTPLAMWGVMETIHQKYEPKFRRKPVTKPTLRMEVSHPLKRQRDGHSKTGTTMRFGFLMSSIKKSKPRRERRKDKASSIWTEHRYLPVFTLTQSQASLIFIFSSTASTLTGT